MKIFDLAKTKTYFCKETRKSILLHLATRASSARSLVSFHSPLCGSRGGPPGLKYPGLSSTSPLIYLPHTPRRDQSLPPPPYRNPLFSRPVSPLSIPSTFIVVAGGASFMSSSAARGRARRGKAASGRRRRRRVGRVGG